jgi:hypothetical protein
MTDQRLSSFLKNKKNMYIVYDVTYKHGKLQEKFFACISGHIKMIESDKLRDLKICIQLISTYLSFLCSSEYKIFGNNV